MHRVLGSLDGSDVSAKLPEPASSADMSSRGLPNPEVYETRL
jgi:hypothetical protein